MTPPKSHGPPSSPMALGTATDLLSARRWTEWRGTGILTRSCAVQKGRLGKMLFVDLALARRLEAAEAQAGVECAATLARLRPQSAAAAERIAGGVAVFAGVSSPLTQAMGVGLEGPVVEA